jgi:exopolysaccharide biosynthesis protein
MTLEELGDLMVSLGCTTAINTDGGGSSVMAVAERGANGGIKPPLQIVNSPSDGQERGRGNAWVIVRR